MNRHNKGSLIWNSFFTGKGMCCLVLWNLKARFFVWDSISLSRPFIREQDFEDKTTTFCVERDQREKWKEMFAVFFHFNSRCVPFTSQPFFITDSWPFDKLLWKKKRPQSDTQEDVAKRYPRRLTKRDKNEERMTSKSSSLSFFFLLFFVHLEAADQKDLTTTTHLNPTTLSSPTVDQVFVGTFIKSPSIASPFSDEGSDDNKTPSPSLKRIYEFNNIKSQSK